jgi:hypothetical protein
MYVVPAAVVGGAEGRMASSDSCSRMLASLRCAFAKASRIFLIMYVCTVGMYVPSVVILLNAVKVLYIVEEATVG